MSKSTIYWAFFTEAGASRRVRRLLRSLIFVGMLCSVVLSGVAAVGLIAVAGLTSRFEGLAALTDQDLRNLAQWVEDNMLWFPSSGFAVAASIVVTSHIHRYRRHER